MPDADRTGCPSCPSGTFSAFGYSCNPCPEGTASSQDKTQCEDISDVVIRDVSEVLDFLVQDDGVEVNVLTVVTLQAQVEPLVLVADSPEQQLFIGLLANETAAALSDGTLQVEPSWITISNVHEATSSTGRRRVQITQTEASYDMVIDSPGTAAVSADE
jgi:hypothetical protein